MEINPGDKRQTYVSVERIARVTTVNEGLIESNDQRLCTVDNGTGNQHL